MEPVGRPQGNEGRSGPPSRESPASSEHEGIKEPHWGEYPAGSGFKFKEWIPPLLRAYTLLPLAVFCFGMIAALEAFHHATRTQVVSPQNQTVFNLARYMPTVGVIVIGYVFKGVVTDLKKITPWSNMTGNWVSANNSMLLDYVNDLEIVSVFAALRKRHWAMSVGLLMAFGCGALVPFANSLTYINLFSSRTIPATFTQTSVFDFDDSPLVMPNGSLKIPWNYTGSQPYARVYSEQLGNSPPALWSTANYAFDRFTFANASAFHNATLTADVNAIVGNMECHKVRYAQHGDGDSAFEANVEDLQAARCPGPVQMKFYYTATPGSAWLNVTQCSEKGDVRIAANFLSGKNVNTTYGNFSDNLVVQGLLCSPKFSTQQVSLSINATSETITAFSPKSDPQSLDIKTSTEALYVYLQNPLDSSTQELFGFQAGPMDATKKPVGNIGNITSAASRFMYGSKPEFIDGFMKLIINPTHGEKTDDLDFLEKKVVSVATRIWMEVISFMARSGASTSLPGTVKVTEQRLLLRDFALRTSEALLAVIGLFAILFAVKLRPKTALHQDPGPLAAVAAILSTSDKNTENEMAKEAISSEKSMKTQMQATQFTLQPNTQGAYGVAMNGMSYQDREVVTLDYRKLGKANYHAAPNGGGMVSVSNDDDISQGWRPLPLRFASKLALLLAIAAVMIALAIMLWQSNKLNGLCRDTQAASTALTLVTSGLLVLLGYCCAGVDGAAQSMAPFNVMRKRPNQDSLFTDDTSLLGRFIGFGSTRISIALVASAAYLVIIPALKLVAAGLFLATPAEASDAVTINIDNSLVTNLENTFQFDIYASQSQIKRATQFTEWENIRQFDIPARSGTIGNLVLSNLTSIADSADKDTQAGGLIEARVPAIAIDIQCEALRSDNFNVSVMKSEAIDNPNGRNLSFQFFCATQDCHRVFNSSYSISHLYTYEYPSIPSYIGSTAIRNVSAMYATDELIDQPYIVHLADYSSLGGSVTSFHNMTPITNETTWGGPNTFNVSMPAMIATSCTRNLSVVSVNATFTRPSQAKIGGGQELLSWRPTSVDTDSIKYERPYPRLQPRFFAPPMLETSQYVDQNDDLDGRLVGNSLWPNRGSSSNMFELLASDAQNRVGNLSSLLDPEGLAASAKSVYTAYTAQLLTEYRARTMNSSLPSGNETRPAMLFYPQARMRQDARMTYAIEALLAAVACFLCLIFYLFPSKAILPKAPGSIATRFSLLAHSDLVSRMRESQMTNLQQVKNWGEPAALGWWKTSSLSVDGKPSWRWGVDVGQDVNLRSWKDPPPARSVATSSPQLPEIDLPRGDMLPLPSGDRRSSVSSLGGSREGSRQHDRERFSDVSR